MSIYRLDIQHADGKVAPLPSRINNGATIEELQKYARECGYAPEKWENDHKRTLRGIFEQTRITKLNSKDPVSEYSWTPFQRALEENDSLFKHAWQVFVERIKTGLFNGLVDENRRLIATIALIPKVTPSLKKLLKVPPDAHFEVYETASGWCDKDYQGTGTYQRFRDTVINERGVGGRLIFSEARGIGASFVNAAQGWTLMPWKKLPFASALMGWTTGEGMFQKFQLSSGLRIPLPPNGLYSGPEISFAKDTDGKMSEEAKRFLAEHDWSSHHHLWVNDPRKAERFESHIKQDLRIDGAGEEVAAYAYHERWIDALRQEFGFYADNGNGGKLVTSSRALAEFVGAPPDAGMTLEI